MAASAAIPNTPRKPEITVVNKLIGILSPMAPPNTLKKNNNKIPIPNLAIVCPIKRTGLTGAPTSSNSTSIPIIIEITRVELILYTPSFLPSLFIYSKGMVNRTVFPKRY